MRVKALQPESLPTVFVCLFLIYTGYIFRGKLKYPTVFPCGLYSHKITNIKIHEYTLYYQKKKKKKKARLLIYIKMAI